MRPLGVLPQVSPLTVSTAFSVPPADGMVPPPVYLTLPSTAHPVIRVSSARSERVRVACFMNESPLSGWSGTIPGLQECRTGGGTAIVRGSALHQQHIRIRSGGFRARRAQQFRRQTAFAGQVA